VASDRNKLILAGLAGLGGLFVLATLSGSSGRLPRGKGLTAPTVRGRSPDELADEFKAMGIQWAALAGRKGPNNPVTPPSWFVDELPKYADALRARGIQVVIYGWVTSDDWENEADDLLRSADAAKAVAIRINPEAAWTPGTETQRANATKLMDKLTARYPVIVTSYGGGPRYFGSGFPWAEFAEKAAAGAPQLYGQAATLEAREARIQSWRDAGFKVIHPTIGANDEPENIIAEAVATPHDGAIGIWSWGNIHARPSRQAAIASLQVGRTRTTSTEA
jgi:sugar phosphate isomerase/epimerase